MDDQTLIIQSLAGKRVAVFGRLADATIRDARHLIQIKGGTLVDQIDPLTDVVVLGDHHRATEKESVKQTARASVQIASGDGNPEIVHENLFWRMVEPLDANGDVRRLYTVGVMADVLDIPRAAVRHWVRRGLLIPARSVGSLSWFNFEQLLIARGLIRLMRGGLTLREIDTKLSGLAAGGATEAAQMTDRIVADGRRLSLRRGGRLVGSGGQLQLHFYVNGLSEETLEKPIAPAKCDNYLSTISHEDSRDGEDVCLPFPSRFSPGPSGDELLDIAAELEAAGQFVEAGEALRAALQAEGPTSHICFMLAELLYRSGDLTAARERYFMAIELDASHLEARTNLGCVLAELGEHELAIAALEGVLSQQPDYAEAHWHLAGVLEDTGRSTEAKRHWQTFLVLAPASPWAATARKRLASRS